MSETLLYKRFLTLSIREEDFKNIMDTGRGSLRENAIDEAMICRQLTVGDTQDKNAWRTGMTSSSKLLLLQHTHTAT